MCEPKKLLFLLVVLAIIAPVWFVSTQLESSNEYIIDYSDFVNGQDLIENIPLSELTEDEIAGLIQMCEEEKIGKV